jgi:hypothetical protein
MTELSSFYSAASASHRGALGACLVISPSGAECTDGETGVLRIFDRQT